MLIIISVVQLPMTVTHASKVDETNSQAAKDNKTLV